MRLYNPFPRAAGGGGAVQPGKLIQTYSAHGYEVLDIAVGRYAPFPQFGSRGFVWGLFFILFFFMERNGLAWEEHCHLPEWYR